MKKLLDVEITPKDVAGIICNMDLNQQSEMFHNLYLTAGGEYNLMMQFTKIRYNCEKLKKINCEFKGLNVFRAVSSSVAGIF